MTRGRRRRLRRGNDEEEDDRDCAEHSSFELGPSSEDRHGGLDLNVLPTSSRRRTNAAAMMNDDSDGGVNGGGGLSSPLLGGGDNAGGGGGRHRIPSPGEIAGGRVVDYLEDDDGAEEEDDTGTTALETSTNDSSFSSLHSAAAPPFRSTSFDVGGGPYRRRGAAPRLTQQDTGRSRRRFHNGDSSHKTEKRILDRDGMFSQSRGRWSVRSKVTAASSPGAVGSAAGLTRASCLLGRLRCRTNHVALRTRRCWDDWFHSLSYTPTLLLLCVIFAGYLATVVLFAGLYLAVSKFGAAHTHNDDGSIQESSFCGMDITNHMEALYFSLSTMTTIGYGVSDYYFGDCWTPFLLVLLQVFAAIAFDALAIGLLFQRMSRGQKRGRTIVFSDVACVRRVRGQLYLLVRVGELRERAHVLDSRVRAYCVRHERVAMRGGGSGTGGSGSGTANADSNADAVSAGAAAAAAASPVVETAHYVPRRMRLVEPRDDDGNGGYILMSLPNVLVHKLEDVAIVDQDGGADHSEGGVSKGGPKKVPRTSLARGRPVPVSSSPLIPPRPVWYDGGGGAHRWEPERFGDDGEGVDAARSSEVDDDDNARRRLRRKRVLLLERYRAERDEIVRYLRDRDAEVVVLVEGTDEATGSSLQARHSYRWDDLAWDCAFAPCVFPRRDGVGGEEAVVERGGESDDFEDGENGGGGVFRYGSPCKGRRRRAAVACDVDFGRFHDVVPAPPDCDSCPYVPDVC